MVVWWNDSEVLALLIVLSFSAKCTENASNFQGVHFVDDARNGATTHDGANHTVAINHGYSNFGLGLASIRYLKKAKNKKYSRERCRTNDFSQNPKKALINRKLPIIWTGELDLAKQPCP